MVRYEDINKEMKDAEIRRIKRTIKLVIFGILAFIVLIILLSSFYIIKAGQRGILLTWGEANMVPIAEGLHFKIPIAQTIVKMDVQTQKYEAELTAASYDLQDVNTIIVINYHILSERAPEIYRDIGVDYATKIIYPYEQETNKAITSLYTAQELQHKREEVRQKMKDTLYAKLLPRGIIVEEIFIVNFKYSPEYTRSIELKAVAEQDALAAKNKLEQVKYEAEQRIAQAEGEARAIQIQAEAIKAQGGEAYVQLQAIKQWNGILPTIMSGNAMPFIDMRTVTGTSSNINYNSTT